MRTPLGTALLASRPEGRRGGTGRQPRPHGPEGMRASQKEPRGLPGPTPGITSSGPGGGLPAWQQTLPGTHDPRAALSPQRRGLPSPDRLVAPWDDMAAVLRNQSQPLGTFWDTLGPFSHDWSLSREKQMSAGKERTRVRPGFPQGSECPALGAVTRLPFLVRRLTDSDLGRQPPTPRDPASAGLSVKGGQVT